MPCRRTRGPFGAVPLRLHKQGPEGRRRKLRFYSNVGLLCLDEVGYSSCDDKAADLLYEIVNRRYEHKPLIVTTNRDSYRIREAELEKAALLKGRSKP